MIGPHFNYYTATIALTIICALCEISIIGHLETDMWLHLVHGHQSMMAFMKPPYFSKNVHRLRCVSMKTFETKLLI